MVQRIGGMRRKTRDKLKLNYREKGKVPLGRYFQQFEQGAKVALKAHPAVQQGLYFPRFHGRVGTVIGNQGRCYKVQLTEGSVVKTFIVHPVHLQRI